MAGGHLALGPSDYYNSFFIGLIIFYNNLFIIVRRAQGQVTAATGTRGLWTLTGSQNFPQG